jgi:thiol:disulfide interchange protein DsbD
MLKFARSLIAIVAVVLVWAGAGRAAFAESGPVTATLLADTTAAVPGRSFMLGVRLAIKPHWHTYWINPGESGEPTRIKFTGPAGFEFGEIQWPLPSRIVIDGGITYGYENEVLLLVPVKVAKDAAPAAEVKIDAEVTWLCCKETCIEGEAKLAITLPVAAVSQASNDALFDAWRRKLPITKDQSPAAEVLSNVEQATGDDGSSLPALKVTWKQTPRHIEWFPVATSAIAIENVKLSQEGATTRIAFKQTIFKADKLPAGGKLESVLVFEGTDGRRYGVNVPFLVGRAR